MMSFQCLANAFIPQLSVPSYPVMLIKLATRSLIRQLPRAANSRKNTAPQFMIVSVHKQLVFVLR